MLRLFRRVAPGSGVRFCDGCAEVTTVADRARRHRDRAVLRAQATLGPR
jgi:hypothetical protein